MSNIVKKERSSNFELLRIISMFFIVVWHVIFHTGYFNLTTGLTRTIISFIYLFIIIHVNTFMLVTGYFQYDKENIKWKKVRNLIGQVWFYNLGFTLIFYFFKLDQLTNVEWLEAASPFNLGFYWFINAYILIYIFSPFINKVIKNIDKKQFKLLITLFIICYSFIPLITRNRTFNNTGVSEIQFLLMYLIGAYLHKYPIKESIHFKDNSNLKNRLIFFSSFVILGVLNFIIYEFGLNLRNTSTSGVIIDIANTIVEGCQKYSSPLVILQSICFFLFFETLNIKSKFINFVSALTFGIYLCHENPLLHHNVFNWLGLPDSDIGSLGLNIIPKIFLVGTLLFVCSAVVEFIRKKIAIFLSKRKLIVKLDNSVDKLIENF